MSRGAAGPTVYESWSVTLRRSQSAPGGWRGARVRFTTSPGTPSPAEGSGLPEL